jgi:hypothetical protein
MQMTTSKKRAWPGIIVGLLRIVSIFFLVIWPFFMTNLIMLGDNPNVAWIVSLFQGLAYYLTLIFPFIAGIALWFDRKKVREKVGIGYRLKLWLLPGTHILLIICSLIAVFRL